MAGIEPTFITGATAKVRINGKTLAYCQDFSCSVQVLTKTPKVLGKYEGDSVEPLGYMVSGSFSIVRYVKGVKSLLGSHAAPFLADNDAGNGVGNWGTMWDGNGLKAIAARTGVVSNDGRAHEALDPSKFAAGTTFDIQIFQKAKDSTGNPKLLGVWNIRNSRITQADFGLQKKSVGTERYNFVALYADGDGFVADASD